MLSTLFVTMPAHQRKTRVKNMFYHTWLHVGLGNSNSTPYVCAVSTLSAEPYPQPREEYFVWVNPTYKCLGADCLVCLYGQEAARPVWQEYQQRAEIIEAERWEQGRSYGATKKTLIFTPSGITSYWRVHDLTSTHSDRRENECAESFWQSLIQPGCRRGVNEGDLSSESRKTTELPEKADGHSLKQEEIETLGGLLKVEAVVWWL